MKRSAIILALFLSLAAVPASAAGLTVSLGADSANPGHPQMGDHLTFRSTITNTDAAAHEGVIAWLSLVQVDKGQEQPVDLEDWSAHKAITQDTLRPGASITTDWPMRLIKAGQYRVVVSTISRNGAALTPSPFVDFTVKAKPVVESARVLPVALGIPGLLSAFMLFGQLRQRKRRAQ